MAVLRQVKITSVGQLTEDESYGECNPINEIIQNEAKQAGLVTFLYPSIDVECYWAQWFTSYHFG